MLVKLICLSLLIISCCLPYKKIRFLKDKYSKYWCICLLKSYTAFLHSLLTGLSAAKLLVESGLNPVLLEARDRVGGRTFTVQVRYSSEFWIKSNDFMSAQMVCFYMCVKTIVYSHYCLNNVQTLCYLLWKNKTKLAPHTYCDVAY